MRLYRYKSIDKEGTIQQGIVDAHSVQEVHNFLYSLGCSPISISKDLRCYFTVKPNRDFLLELCVFLEQFNRAGIPLKDSLFEIKEIQKSPLLNSLMDSICRSLDQGDMLSVAFSKHPQIFDTIFISHIKIGEKTGNMSTSYQQLILHLQWMGELSCQTWKSLRYPLILCGAVFLLISSLFTFLVPELLAFFDIHSKEIPFSTSLLIRTSSLFSHHYVTVLIGLIGCLMTYKTFILSHREGSRLKEWLINHIPVIGPLRRNLIYTQFFHIFSTLLKGKVDLLEALQSTRLSFSANSIAQIIQKIESQVEIGNSIAHAFQHVGEFPSFVIRMIKIGEQTNSLPESLTQVKSFYEKQLKKRTDNLISSMEPILLLVMGAVLGWIILSLFLPLYESFDQLQS